MQLLAHLVYLDACTIGVADGVECLRVGVAARVAADEASVHALRLPQPASPAGEYIVK